MAKKNNKPPFTYESSPEFDAFLVHFDNPGSAPDPPPGPVIAVQALPKLPSFLPVNGATETSLVDKPAVTAGHSSLPDPSSTNESSLREEPVTLVESAPDDAVVDSSPTVPLMEPEDDTPAKLGIITDLQLPETVLRPVATAGAVGRNSPRRGGVDKVVRGSSVIESLDEFTAFLRGLSHSKVPSGPFTRGERKVRVAEDVGEALQTMSAYLKVTGTGSCIRVDDLVDDLLRRFITEHLPHFLSMSESLLAITASRPDETRNNPGK